MIKESPISALVTGGTRGIGFASALKLAPMCNKLCITYCHDEERAEAAAKQLTESGRCEIIVERCDVREPDAVKALFSTLKKKDASPGIVVNNAGVITTNYVRFMSQEEWRTPIDISLNGTFHVTRASLKGMMRNHWGRIINITSDAGLMGDAMRSAYAAAKAGVIGFTLSTAREVAAMGITVNAVAPGLIETRMAHDMPETRRETMLTSIPMGKIGTPSEVGDLVAFLASDDAAYITGQTICVDGGMNMRH